MDSDNARKEFARRLKEACDDMHIPEYGRLRQLAKLFGVSPQAVKKWLDADGFPQTDTVLAIADWAKVNVNWLLQGAGPKRVESPEAAITVAEGIADLPDDHKLQLIDYMRYAFHKPKSWFAEERRAKLDAALDDLQKKAH